jgi:hypothetical protein
MLGKRSVRIFNNEWKVLVTSDCNSLVKMDLVIWLVPLSYASKNCVPR